MVFAYSASDDSGRLSQGEILRGVTEPTLIRRDGQIVTEQQEFSVELTLHPKVIVVTADCDLFSDFCCRFDSDTSDKSAREVESRKSQLLDHVICCEAYDEVEVRQELPKGSDLWNRVRSNQEQRYHCIPKGTLEGQQDSDEPEYYLDFKKVFTLPTSWLYESIRSGEVKRKGVIPQPWVQSLVQRMLAYQGRVGLPDPSDPRKLPRIPDLLAVTPSLQLPDTSPN